MPTPSPSHPAQSTHSFPTTSIPSFYTPWRKTLPHALPPSPHSATPSNKRSPTQTRLPSSELTSPKHLAHPASTNFAQHSPLARVKPASAPAAHLPSQA